MFYIMLQTAAHDGVKLWDLRKLRNFRTFSPYDSDTPTNAGKKLTFSPYDSDTPTNAGKKLTRL
jgi:hypothetical protein